MKKMKKKERTRLSSLPEEEEEEEGVTARGVTSYLHLLLYDNKNCCSSEQQRQRQPQQEGPASSSSSSSSTCNKRVGYVFASSHLHGHKTSVYDVINVFLIVVSVVGVSIGFVATAFGVLSPRAQVIQGTFFIDSEGIERNKRLKDLTIKGFGIFSFFLSLLLTLVMILMMRRRKKGTRIREEESRILVQEGQEEEEEEQLNGITVIPTSSRVSCVQPSLIHD